MDDNRIINAIYTDYFNDFGKTSEFEELTELYDDYVEAKEEPNKFNLKKELNVKHSLKKLYES